METGGEKKYQVWTGRHVILELIFDNGEIEKVDLDLVPDSAADFDNGFLGESTPLAKAILGQYAGMTVPYRAGDIVHVRILSVTNELSSAPVDLTARREETTRKAVEDSNTISTVIYASTMSNKWGDMDPNLIKDDEEEQEKEEK